MRLIDADAALSALRRVSMLERGDCRRAILRCLGVVERAPTADAVEVVRCRDCDSRVYINMGDEVGLVGGCSRWKTALPSDFFCANGKRGEG